MIRPIDTEEHVPVQTPMIQRQQSSKSPVNFPSPVILDFLDDDNYFKLEDDKHKSKTEFVRRERQESEDSAGNQEDQLQVPGVTDEYLNSILNNSIRFTKPTQSVTLILIIYV